MKTLKIVEVRSEIGAGTRGSSLGIDAVKLAAVNAESPLFERHQSQAIETENHLLFEADKFPEAHRIDGISRMYSKISNKIAGILEAEEAFPVVLAADHASAGGTIAGIKKAFPSKRLGVIWVDAHADLHSPFTSPSGNVHGMPLASALGEDNRESRRRQVGEVAYSHWEAMKNEGGISPKIRPEDIFFIAVRSTEPEEEHIINKHSIPNCTVKEFREKGFEAVSQMALDHLSECDLIYISFDVDSMDPDAISYGTGTPVKDGLLEEEAAQLLCSLAASPKLICFEMVEVNPLLDNRCNAMGEAAFRVIEQVAKTLSA